MPKAVKYVEKAAVYAAKGAWVVFEKLNRISPNDAFTTSLCRRAGRRKSLLWAGRARPIRFAPSAYLRFASRFLTASCRTKFC